MTARIRSKESRFKAGEKIQLFQGPLLKHLSYQHCYTLEVGERIWLTTSVTGVFVATTVTKVLPRNIAAVISYAAGNSTGHFTVEPKKSTRCYRFLDEEALVPSQAENSPSLRLVGKN